ncbi:translation initiation factor IF-2 [Nocardioides sp. S5]|uniref:aminoglycoside phosphotransferase family protein n=1 Tax=Nocardioides sp. S5 TaxID=2017486 RepID=UPI001A8CF5F0|nr:aminoglycoside phosphotransferase family protein [Nocardioides sp. S5]QSR31537.1 translation initiation factor IF-2 [Nocardioides sp. S5]
MQTSTHGLTLGEREVRKEFVADHGWEAEREWACLTLLAEHAPGLAPRPLRREDGERPVIVMERISGDPLAPRPLTAGQTEALGAALRRLYDVPVQAVTDAGIGPRRYGAAEHAQVMVEWLADDHDLRECRDPGLVGEALDAARAFVADPPVPEPRFTALGIADLNPANVLWDGRDVRLVDFEDGGLSDPAYELADHVEHLGGRLPGVYDARALADAVGLDARDRERMAAYRPLWAVFWLAMLLPGNGGWRRNPPGTTEAQAEHFMALAGHH